MRAFSETERMLRLRHLTRSQIEHPSRRGRGVETGDVAPVGRPFCAANHTDTLHLVVILCEKVAGDRRRRRKQILLNAGDAEGRDVLPVVERSARSGGRTPVGNVTCHTPGLGGPTGEIVSGDEWSPTRFAIIAAAAASPVAMPLVFAGPAGIGASDAV